LRSACLEREIAAFLELYRQAFDMLDADAIADLYAVPSGIVSGSVHVHWPTRDAIVANMRALCTIYRDTGDGGQEMSRRDGGMSDRVRIRSAKVADAERLLAYVKEIRAENLPTLFRHANLPSLDEERAFLGRFQSERAVYFVADLDGALLLCTGGHAGGCGRGRWLHVGCGAHGQADCYESPGRRESPRLTAACFGATADREGLATSIASGQGAHQACAEGR